MVWTPCRFHVAIFSVLFRKLCRLPINPSITRGFCLEFFALRIFTGNESQAHCFSHQLGQKLLLGCIHLAFIRAGLLKAVLPIPPVTPHLESSYFPVCVPIFDGWYDHVVSPVEVPANYLVCKLWLRLVNLTSELVGNYIVWSLTSQHIWKIFLIFLRICLRNRLQFIDYSITNIDFKYIRILT